MKSGRTTQGEMQGPWFRLTHSGLDNIHSVARPKEAMRLGLVQFGEAPVRVATTAELEQIRSAGLRAINADTQLAGK